MSEHLERLWPPDDEQPKIELSVGDESYLLTWQNTMLQAYRTGIEEYDEQLKKYDHVLYICAIKDDENEYAVLFFDELGEEIVTLLLENNYIRQIRPIPEPYILEEVAKREMGSIPDAIGPEFGASAA